MEGSFTTVLVAEPADGRVQPLLAEHGGREVRTTHDELTAAFPSAVGAVRCACAMQREAGGAGLRIGLAAGEEGGDPALVAAQLCRIANEGEILASEVVRLIAGPREVALLQPAGAYKLRGVAERVAVSRVAWDGEPPPAEPARAPTISVVIADDERLLRAGFRVILDAEADLRVVGEAADGREAVDVVRRRRPDVVLMDVRMPELDGLAAARRILEDPENATAVVMLTTFDLSQYVYDALRMGASGFLLKDAPADRLLDAVRVAAAGDALLAPSVTRRLIEEFSRAPRVDPGGVPPRLQALTERELDVLRLVARGLSNAEIAGELILGENTIKTHLARVFRKLELRDRAQAVVVAYETGLVVPEGDDGG